VPEISWADFEKVEMRVGRVVAVEPSPARKPSYKVTIDFGPHGTRVSSVGVREWYAPDDLKGRLVVCVMNFPPRQVGPVRSEVLTMGAVEADPPDSDGRVVLLQPDRDCEPGARIA
jgi:tRNA-binding protein